MLATRHVRLPPRFLIFSLLALRLAGPSLAAPSRPLATVPFHVHDNRILVEVMLNGRGPFTMVFDTGASNVMTPECRERLGLAVGANDSTSGAGEKQVAVQVARVATMQVGGLELRDQDFVVVDLGEIRRTFHFPRLDGIVGEELLERAHARVDFDRGTLRLTEFDSDTTAVPKDAIRFEKVGGSPVVDGHINGVAARLLIDTGDRSNLTVFEKFAASSGLDSLFKDSPEIPTGVGVGGPIAGRVTTLASVDFGTFVEREIVARLPSTRGGLFATSPLAASVGLGMLMNYNLDIDYRSRYIVLRRRSAPRSRSEFVPVPTR